MDSKFNFCKTKNWCPSFVFAILFTFWALESRIHFSIHLFPEFFSFFSRFKVPMLKFKIIPIIEHIRQVLSNFEFTLPQTVCFLMRDMLLLESLIDFFFRKGIVCFDLNKSLFFLTVTRNFTLAVFWGLLGGLLNFRLIFFHVSLHNFRRQKILLILNRSLYLWITIIRDLKI